MAALRMESLPRLAPEQECSTKREITSSACVQARLSRFQGANAISSADFYDNGDGSSSGPARTGSDFDITAGDLVNRLSMQVCMLSIKLSYLRSLRLHLPACPEKTGCGSTEEGSPCGAPCIPLWLPQQLMAGTMLLRFWQSPDGACHLGEHCP